MKRFKAIFKPEHMKIRCYPMNSYIIVFIFARTPTSVLNKIKYIGKHTDLEFIRMEEV